MDSFSVQGQWWLPNLSEHSVCGSLHFSPYERSSLELIGAFKNNDSFLNEYELVLGTSLEGASYTLLGLLEFYRQRGKFTSQKFYVNSIFSGCTFFDHENILFDSIIYKYLIPFQWFIRGGLQPLKNNIYGFKYNNNFAFSVQLDDFKIDFCNSPNQNNTPREINFKELCSVQLTPKAPQKYDYYKKKLLTQFMALLYLCHGISIYPEEIIGTFSEEDYVNIYHTLGSHIINYNQLVDPPISFIPFSLLGNDPEEFIREWFINTNILIPALDSYLANASGQIFFTEERFLNNTRIIEKMYQEEQKKTNYEFIDTIKYYLERANDIRTIAENKEQFIEDAVNSRHYYAHYSKKREGTQLKGVKLKLAELLLQIIIEINLALKTGIGAGKVKQMIGSSSTYVRASQLRSRYALQ